MAVGKFGRVGMERKGGMRSFVESWKRSGTALTVLEESLIVLASDNRPSALELLNAEAPSRESRIAGISCTYGKGSIPRLALSKKDASLLLELVAALRKNSETEESARRMVVAAADMLLGNAKPSTLADPSWKPLLKVLSGFDPAIGQGELL
ncbi:MAG: hypothetical protein AB1324_07725 [Candidatus Micrarchaeota archaeon]